jgi:hypothetical protein
LTERGGSGNEFLASGFDADYNASWPEVSLHKNRKTVVIVFTALLFLSGCGDKVLPTSAPTRSENRPTVQPTQTLSLRQGEGTMTPEPGGTPLSEPTVRPATAAPRPSMTPVDSVTPSPTVPVAPTATAAPAVPSPTTPAEATLAITQFTVATEDLEQGKRLSFAWKTTGATEVRLILGTARRFIPWWTLPPEGSHTVELAVTGYRDPTASLTAYDQAGNQVTQQITIDWPCEHDYFFAPAPEACPLFPPAYTAAADQLYERGRMIWLERIETEAQVIERIIFALYDDGSWQQFDDTWTPDQPESDPSIVPPEGLSQPIRGFGKVWRSNNELREGLGWARTKEFGYEAAWQQQMRESIPGIVFVRTLEGQVVQLEGWGMGSGHWEMLTPSKENP